MTNKSSLGNTGAFAKAHDFTVKGDLIDVQGNYNYIMNISSSSVPALPPLPPQRHSSSLFIGCDQYLQRLKNFFNSHFNQQRKSLLIYGMGGVGKTQICLKFTEHYANIFSDIFWVDASSDVDLRFRQIAQADNAPPHAMTSAASALKWISKKTNWLIVYDNADGCEVVEKFLPPGSGGNILITSRNEELTRITKEKMEILEMEEEEALSLLLGSVVHNEHVHAQELISSLGGIPLAIDQARAYMLSCHCSVDDYLTLYKKKQDQLMSDNKFKGASVYGSSTYGAWDLSMQEIEARAINDVAAQSAMILLRVFTFLHHENIPEKLFKNASENYKQINVGSTEEITSAELLDAEILFLDGEGEWDQVKFHSGVQTLLSFSLIRKSDKFNIYSIHPLVHSWSRSKIPEEDLSDHCHKTRALLACSVSMDHIFSALLASHIRANNNHVTRLGLISYENEYHSFAEVFQQLGCWDEVQKLWVDLIEIWTEKYGLDDPYYTHFGMGNLGVAYVNLGRGEDAERLLMHVVETQKTTLGPDHSNTLITMGNLGLAYICLGKWEDAERLLMHVVEAQKTMLGPDHPSTLINMGNLGLAYTSLGKWEDAERLLMHAVEAQKTKLGPEHPKTLANMGNLGLAYTSLGKWEDAERLLMHVVEAQKAKLGQDHPHALINMGTLGLVYTSLGKWEDVEGLLIDVVEAQKAKLGPEHPETLFDMGNLGLAYTSLGKWEDAERLLTHVVEAQKTKLGPDHPKTLANMSNLGLAYTSLGKWEDAEKLLMDVVKAQKAMFGSDHPSTLQSTIRLTIIYMRKGAWDDAEKLQVKLLEVFKSLAGQDHLDTLKIMAILAMINWKQEKLDLAASSFSAVIDKLKNVLESQHPIIITLMEILHRIRHALSLNIVENVP